MNNPGLPARDSGVRREFTFAAGPGCSLYRSGLFLTGGGCRSIHSCVALRHVVTRARQRRRFQDVPALDAGSEVSIADRKRSETMEIRGAFLRSVNRALIASGFLCASSFQGVHATERRLRCAASSSTADHLAQRATAESVARSWCGRNDVAGVRGDNRAAGTRTAGSWARRQLNFIITLRDEEGSPVRFSKAEILAAAWGKVQRLELPTTRDRLTFSLAQLHRLLAANFAEGPGVPLHSIHWPRSDEIRAVSLGRPALPGRERARVHDWIPVGRKGDG